eukprot:796762-Pleurochrysis_carterae.AAC.1
MLEQRVCLHEAPHDAPERATRSSAHAQRPWSHGQDEACEEKFIGKQKPVDDDHAWRGFGRRDSGPCSGVCEEGWSSRVTSRGHEDV